MTIDTSDLSCGPAPRHYILAAYEAWGHARPLCTLAARICKSRPVTLTVFVTRSFYDRAENEISRNFSPAEADVQARIRLVAVHTRENVHFDVETFNASFLDALKKLVREEPIVCAKTNAQIPAVGSPDAAIFDLFSYSLALHVRKWSEKDAKVICWAPVSAMATYYLFGPSGGFDAETPHLIEEEISSSGRSFAEVAEDIFCHKNGQVMEVPGIPPMYDYEHYPQKVSAGRLSAIGHHSNSRASTYQMIIPDIKPGVHHLAGLQFMHACDAVLVSTAECFEPPEAIRAFENWFAETSRKAYIAGPMIPLGPQALDEKQQSPQAAEIAEFMARILQSHGHNSLIYISFGSVFWSVEPEKIWTFVDVLLEKKFPFIMSHGSPFAQVPDWVREKVKASGLAVLSSWSPQQTILRHPVMGWFVTHCGWNSLVESVSAGVPMICWPYQADQALDTVHLTDNAQIAYELSEVRTGDGLRPVYRTGKVPVATLDAIREESSRILSLAFGPDGAEKRMRVLKLKEKASKLWEPDGASRLTFESFLDDLN
ncbi:hypothetical protein NM688_g398 [Phlebia brevispora]|uniref:Uncharacterized protein n=1 Tax=Phlebia brevispora TaxID=194682 RepID=A0ACC1TE87_9APHY|nr:hypothetical protein NM688_g398 [Phlebia brevispora]